MFQSELNKDGLKIENDELRKEIEKRVSKKLEELKQHPEQEIDPEIEREIEFLLKKEVGEVARDKFEPRDKQADAADSPSKKIAADVGKVIQDLRTMLSDLAKSFGPCWNGACRFITVINFVAYAAIIILMISCSISTFSFCARPGFAGALASIILIALVSLSISLMLAIASKDSQTALVFALTLASPLAVIILVSIIGYVSA